MTIAQRRNGLTTHFSERIPVVKRRMTVLFVCPSGHSHMNPPMSNPVFFSDSESSICPSKGSLQILVRHAMGFCTMEVSLCEDLRRAKQKKADACLASDNLKGRYQCLCCIAQRHVATELGKHVARQIMLHIKGQCLSLPSFAIVRRKLRAD